MPESEVRIYPYRWLVLAVFMLINVTMQILWICYAPVATAAAGAYHVKREDIDLLANIFLLVYVPIAIPAAWAIDTFGFKKAVGVGATFMALFGMLRAMFPTSYTMALVGSIGVAIGQPFLLNAFTKLAALWFPKKQRATITGVIFLGLFLGIGLGEALGPGILTAYGFARMQLIYGIAALATAVLFLVFARAKPPTPAGPAGEEVRALVLDSFRQILKNRNMYVLALALFIASGIVNSVFTLIDGLGKELSLSVSDGVLLTSILLLGGIVGSIVVPAISDAIRRRKPILVAAVFLGVPSTIGLVLARGLAAEVVFFFVMGICITGVVPVAYQYGAEITHPAPEGTSNGMLALVVQAAGLLIVLMDALRGLFHDSYIPSFIGLAVILAASGFMMLGLKESPEMERRMAKTEALSQDV
ncbi:MAG TPA: MFS transporter [Spirochaetia bacterium]|nr:MFS transporter [Spirochaetia bacterium]